MSGFVALNVEPEDTFEEEVDDTKEIQIEEAFKLYQNALKLHSQGPAYYDTAEAAYNELFASEVFKYPDALTDYGHEQLEEISALPTLTNDQAAVPVLPANAADSAANSLPQLIYLAYKNRGQFVLDVARHQLDVAAPDRRSVCLYYYRYCLQSLEDSANALERDDSDLDLWKKAARIADILSSQRLVRFCLESVVAGDDDTGEQTVDLSGLDEAFASGELLQVVKLIQDDVAVAKTSSTQAQHALLQMLRKSNDPYPFLPQRGSQIEYLDSKQRPNVFDVKHVRLEPTERNQAALADALITAMGKEDNINTESKLGYLATINLHSSSVDDGSSISIQSSPTKILDLSKSIPPPDLMTEELKPASSNASAQSPGSYHSAQDEVQPDHQEQTSTSRPQDESVMETIRTQEPGLDGLSEAAQSEVRLPTRKRSSTAAGNDEPESRAKSKRLRARESLMEVTAHEEETAMVNDYHMREQLAILEDLDSVCVTYVNKILTKLNVDQILTTETSQEMQEPEVSTKNSASLQARFWVGDMVRAMASWSEDTNAAIVSGHSSRDVVEKSGGMSLFQRHLKAAVPRDVALAGLEEEDETLVSFTRVVNHSSLTLVDTAILWLVKLLVSDTTSGDSSSSYLHRTWPLEMRNNIIHILIQVDEYLLQYMIDYVRSSASETESIECHATILNEVLTIAKIAELVQTILEMHLDEYYIMTTPESRINSDAKLKQRERLDRWAHISTSIIPVYCSNELIEQKSDSLVLRFLYVSALYAGLSADNDKTHILSCLNDVRAILEGAANPVIVLPNNKSISQVSIAAVDQEISRLSTLDFFNNVFDNDNSDPVSTIMKLEPILEPDSIQSPTSPADSLSSNTSNQQNQMAELRSFLDSGDASLKLFLWRRLQNGYTAISYTPKVVSCLLRSLEIVVGEIQTERHSMLEPQDRQLAMLRWIRDADEMMVKIISKISDEPKAFECLDEAHLRSTLSAISRLIEVLLAFVKYDDSIRVGHLSPPSLRTNTAMKMFDKSRDKLRDIFVRCWTLMYHLIKEATLQLREVFDHPVDQLAEYLRLVHNMFGYRQYCKQCNKLFVKLTKSELFSIRSDIDYSEDIAQILYDMYQIRLGNGFGDADHGCSPDALGRDKETAFHLVPVIMKYAQKLNMRELIKGELKSTVDKIQQTLGQVKLSPALSVNRKAVSAFLKSQINPQEVYRSLKGFGDLITKTVSGDYAKVAAQGWYQMLGKMSLAKYKSIKRVNPTPTDDLDTAGTFLRLDIEHNITSWESWYRLAQVFDSKIEDSLIWNSLKINDSRGEIALLERNAINSYTMAVAMAMRGADDTADTIQKISDMFSEFAIRLYASSRPPLSMEAFNTDKYMRHLSSSQDSTMSKAPFVFPFKPYAVWGFAAYLLQKKFTAGQKEWLCYYTLGKCFWKMYQSSENMKMRKPITVEDVLDAFTDAVYSVPAKEKSSDYILEPHYKLVSVVHKLVTREALTPAEGVRYLEATPFARAVHLSQDEHGLEWDKYILDILRKLGHADKSNWHHRITARAAHVNYDDDPSNIAGALGAKHQFTQQIFTKTMTMQVWKPEYERPGRHYVYTGRYLSFFVHLLDRLNDRAGLEQLVRRIRRKTTDFLDHPKIWEETASTYIKLLRRIGKIPDGQERNVFDKLNHEDFTRISEKVEKWAHDPENTSAYQDIVQDAIELKKLNNSLMKGPAIDDLIGDAYACMYETYVEQHPPEEVVSSSVTTLPQGTFINMNTDVVPSGDDNLDRMRLNNLLQSQTEGSLGVSTLNAPPLGLGIQSTPAGTPPPDPVRIPTPSKPGRIKTITRREVQRKAEACIVKPPPTTIKTPTLAKRPFVMIPSRRDSTASNLQDAEDNIEDSRMSSRQASASVRSSPEQEQNDADRDGEADDESELSDPENEEDDDDLEADRDIEDNLVSRKRKAEDEDNPDRDEEDDPGDDEPEEEENENEDNVGDQTGEEQNNEDEEMQDVEETVVEIQDSQEPIVSMIEVSAPIVRAHKTRSSSGIRRQ